MDALLPLLSPLLDDYDIGTTILITPPNGTQETIKEYESCSVSLSVSERAGSFSVTIPFHYNDDISRFRVGSDVMIMQNGHVFRGWVMKPPIKRSGAVKTITLEGADYTAKTQKIIVTESYTDVALSDIVTDLFSKYVPWATRNNISSNDRVLTIKFPDVFLWDAMEQICGLVGYDWYIDSDLDVNFFETANSINENIITENSYKRGTASFTKDSTKLVNKLWVKGSKTLSLPYTQDITVSGNTPIPLYYKPRSGTDGISIIIDGDDKTLGIQNINSTGTKDFLINSNEKLLIPDLVTSGTGTITYCYEYPIKILLENEESKATYGEFEDVLNIDIDDSSIAREVGTKYLDKYCNPVTVGSIEVFNGIYKCGELIKVTLDAFDLDEYLVIKSVSYESYSGIGQVSIKLTLENTQRDLTSVLKDMSKRLNKIEKTVFSDNEDTIVQRYASYNDTLVYPKLTDDGIAYNLHDFMIAGSNILGGTFYI